ncbi:acyl-CoA dehydrogenase C-terminal domain-containing protein [Paraburkholderia sp. EG286B]|uniref:acyl-CoA dehydrogenase C-terminal domain-containing protein n=1 Tax=Paraburkholderia sp. EG286B TaxID=3237011 RepID=UPI0034D1E199
MSGYTAPLRDLQFVMKELLPALPFKAAGEDEADWETVGQVLTAAGQFAEEVIAPLNRVGDVSGCTMPMPGVVKTPPGYREAYAQFRENGWAGLACSPGYGGLGMSGVVEVAVEEILGGANMAWTSYPAMSHATYVNVEANASPELKAIYLPKLATGEWAGTMCLTEPNAGTDLGLLRTRAEPQADGSCVITGTKIFISGGEQDLTENIVHLVLARLPNAPSGVKGISLFVVPKFLPNADGSVGQRNPVTCGSIEEKMGIHGNSTCTINFDGARGWLVGEPNKGLAGMFVQMNYMRVLVGVVGTGVAEAAYQKALNYARERLQGRTPVRQADGAAEAIVRHADVRRMLATQKARIEGMRALALWAARLADVQREQPGDVTGRVAGEHLSLLTPVIKALGSDLAMDSTLLAMQVFGGHGYIRENGVEQHARDVRIIALYEGTNGVQAMDLLGRKVVGDGGARMSSLLGLVCQFVEENTASKELQEFVGPLADLFQRATKATALLVDMCRDDPDVAGANATAYLRLVGHVLLAWVWAHAAKASVVQAAAGDAFYASKVATARFYYQRLLPEHLALCSELSSGSAAAMDPALGLD